MTELLSQAIECCERHQFAEAEKFCHRVIEQQGRHFEVLFVLSTIRFAQGNCADARNWLDEAVSFGPPSVQAYQQCAQMACWLGRLRLGLHLISQAITLETASPELYVTMGEILMNYGRLDKAKCNFEIALARKSELRSAAEGLSTIERLRRDLQSLASEIQGLRQEVSPKGIEEPKNLYRREYFPNLLNELKLVDTAVEVGVKEGEFSDHLLNYWNGRQLYSIDPWREFPTDEYADVANVSQAQHDEYYIHTIKRLRPFEYRSVIWRLTSEQAAGIVDNDSLDFCYLDADHSYDAVKNDIQLWYPKIKPGGILAGHDYVADGSYPFGAFGVQRAVRGFAGERKLSIYTTMEVEFPSWFVVKPR